MKDLRIKTIRAGFFSIVGRGAMVLLRLVSIAVLGRLLSPADYGLVGMVMVVTGILSIFSGFGLSQAAIQRDDLSDEQASAMFWVNVLLGAALTLVVVALGPALSAFYREPRLTAIASVTAVGFLITAAGVQHGASLRRQMRFGAAALINVAALLISISISIAMAIAGFGYWAVVSTSISMPLVTTLGSWLATGWVPGPPRMNTSIRPMLHFGGTVTLTSFVSAIGDNFDKLLLGRFWGAEALGIYSRAYYLVWFPCDHFNATVGEVAFAALSRTKDDPERLKRYFLKGCSLVAALALPASAASALFAEDVIALALGPNWGGAVPIFRILAPAMIMLFMIAHPLDWLMSSLGHVRRSLRISLVSSPLMIVALSVGLPYGPVGMANAYAAGILLKMLPLAAWALEGTGIRFSEVLRAFGRPLVATLVAAGLASAAHALYAPMLPLVPRLFADLTVFGATYVAVLAFFADQNAFYRDLFGAGASPSG